MFEFLARLFDTTGFVPRKTCGEWSPALMWMHIGGDLFIWLAYLSIPLVLLYFTRRRDLPYPKLFVLFALYILACGFGHLIEALMFNYPLYRLAGVWKVFTAIVSWATVLALIPVIPRVMEAVAASGAATPSGAFGNTTLHRLATPISRDRVGDYTVAILAGVLALLIRAAVDEIVETDHVYVLSLLVVVFVSWQSGFGPGIVTLLISMVGMVYFFVPPRGSFVVEGFGNQLVTALFFFCGVCCAGLGEAQRVARKRAKQALAVALEQKDELSSEMARRRETEDRLRQALAAANAGAWEYDLATNRVQWSPQMYELYGLDANSPAPPLDRFAELVHPWDRSRAVAEMAACGERGGPFEIQFRIVRPDGREVWVVSSGVVELFANGGAVARGIDQDITARKRVEENLRESEARFRSMADSVPALIWLAERDEKRTYFNKTWLEFTGRTVKQEIGDGWTASIHPEDRNRYLEKYTAAFASRRGFEIEYRLRRHDGASRWMLARGTPRFTPSGEFAGFVGLCLDVTDRRDAEHALRESEERRRMALEAAELGAWNIDPETNELTSDARFQTIYTGGVGPLSYEQAFAAIHPDDRQRVRNEVAAATRPDNPKPYAAEYRVIHADAQVRWVFGKGRAYFQSDGLERRLVSFDGTVADVTERKRAEEAVRESEERFRTLTEAIPQIVWNADANGNVSYVNNRWTESTGTDRNRPLGAGWLDAVHPDDRGRVTSAWRKTTTEAVGRIDQFKHELRLHQVDGTYRWFLTVAVPLRGPNGLIDRWIGSMADIHDQKTAASQIAESEEKFRTLTEAMPQFVWTSRPDGWCDYLSRQWVEYTGIPEAEQLGAKWLAQVHPDDQGQLAAKWRATVTTETNLDVEFRIRRHDGVYRWFKTRAVPFRDAAGTIVKWVGTNTDIDDTKQAEAGLRAAMERFRTLTETLPQMVWTADPKGEVHFFNRRWDEYTGVPLSAGRLDGFGDVVHPEDVEQFRAEWQLATAHQGDQFAQEFRLRRAADGAYRWMLFNAVTLRDPAGNVAEWVGSITDIDDQKRYAETLERTVQERTADLQRLVEERTAAEAEVRKQREFLDVILDNVADGIVACDATGTLTMFNRAAMDFHGLPPEPIPSDEWASYYDLYRPDGTTRLPDEELPLLIALRGGRVRNAEMVIAPRDRAARVLLANGERLTDAEGRNLGAVVSMRDVTELREADRQLREAATELRRTNTELARSNGELEQFAYVASHDLQEPLRKIQAFGDRLVTRVRGELPENGKEYVDRMLTSAGRMRRLIDDLLTFSRVTTQAKPFARLNLSKIAHEVVSDLSERIEPVGGDVRIGDLPAIDADPTQMRQLFQNLIANAVKFQRRGVPPVVQVTAELLPELPDATGPTGPACRLTVQDNGIGFDEKYKNRIFQVFQRLHGREEYEGTGVGLAICRKIVERHGGTITARSRLGEGTAFIITLPIHHSQPTDPPSDD